jgi:hypothetical protein
MSSNIRSAFRTLYRELSKQQRLAYASQNEKDLKRQDAIRAYRTRLTATGLEVPEKMAKADLEPNKFVYDSQNLKDVFRASPLEDVEFATIVAKYLKHQHTYKELVRRYNPEMETDERLRLSAKKVGLELPVDNYQK